MHGRAPIWGGAGVAVVALAGLGTYFALVGLDKADKLASVIGVFVAVAGLGVAVYGLIAGRRGNGRRARPDGAVVSVERSIVIDGDNRGIASTGDNATNTSPR
ncbi:hypothetical protein AB0392_14760 [Nonomuraea angiospora]|uniref:hypothetical protein n=1 Tax=Nonomuraea angiospora TaxID=46172 RepID=UPI00344D5F31